jgi:hypothetical protein
VHFSCDVSAPHVAQSASWLRSAFCRAEMSIYRRVDISRFGGTRCSHHACKLEHVHDVRCLFECSAGVPRATTEIVSLSRFTVQQSPLEFIQRPPIRASKWPLQGAHDNLHRPRNLISGNADLVPHWILSAPFFTSAAHRPSCDLSWNRDMYSWSCR